MKSWILFFSIALVAGCASTGSRTALTFNDRDLKGWVVMHDGECYSGLQNHDDRAVIRFRNIRIGGS